MNTPKDLISFENMKQMLDNYTKNPIKSNSVWMSLDKLKDYISFIEEESSKKEIPLSGVRVHFIANNKQQTSIALSPTYKDLKLKAEMPHISFDPVFSKSKKPTILSELLADTTKSKEVSSVQNGYILCPKFCPEK